MRKLIGVEVVALFVAVAFVGGCFIGNAEAADEVTVTGAVKVTKGDDGNVVKVVLADADGNVYEVEQDEQGKKLAAEADGTQVKATGTVSAAGDVKTIKVASYSKVEGGGVETPAENFQE